jgi:hypothetical protein
MSLPSYVVEGRANLLARVKLVFDLLFGIGLYLSGASLLLLLVPVADLLLLVPYLRYVKRKPALLTLGTLTISSGMLALAPFAMGIRGLALWVLFPLLPAAAGFVLGRRLHLWQMAAITTVLVAAATVLLIRLGPALTFDAVALMVLAAATAASIALTGWITARTLRPERGSREILGQPLPVVRGVMVVPFNWVVGGVSSDALRSELSDLKRQYSLRWIVLDLAPAGDLGRQDLQAIEEAALGASSPQCAIVMARPPVDALGHLDFARAVIGRIERFATVPQAVEAGLRRLGWTQATEQPQRVVTVYDILGK